MEPREDDPRASEASAAVATSPVKKKHCCWPSILMWAACTTLCAQITGVGGLKNVRVVSPGAVAVGETAALECQYDLEGAELYAVKWYKGKKEFYRYLPKEDPPTKVFPLPGINVDLSESDAHHVVLRDAGFTLTGRYRCEVSADAPSFDTALVVASLVIVEDRRSGVGGEETNSDEGDGTEGAIREDYEDEEWEEGADDWDEEDEDELGEKDKYVDQDSMTANLGKVFRSRCLGFLEGLDDVEPSEEVDGMLDCADELETGVEYEDSEGLLWDSEVEAEGGNCEVNSPYARDCYVGNTLLGIHEDWEGKYGDPNLWEEEEISGLAWQSGPIRRGCANMETDSLESMGGKQARWLGCDGIGSWNGQWSEDEWSSWWDEEDEDEDYSEENLSANETGGCETSEDNRQGMSEPGVERGVGYHFEILNGEASAEAEDDDLGGIPAGSGRDRALKRLEVDQLILNILEALARVIDGILDLIIILFEEGRHLEEEEMEKNVEEDEGDPIFGIKEGKPSSFWEKTGEKEAREGEKVPDVWRLAKFIEGLRNNGQRELKTEGNDVVNYKNEGEWYEMGTEESSEDMIFSEEGEESEEDTDDGDSFLPKEEDLVEELVPFLPGVAIDGVEYGDSGELEFEGDEILWRRPKKGASSVEERVEFVGGGWAGPNGAMVRRGKIEVVPKPEEGMAEERKEKYTLGGGEGLADEGILLDDTETTGENIMQLSDGEVWEADEEAALFPAITDTLSSQSDEKGVESVWDLANIEGMESASPFVDNGIEANYNIKNEVEGKESIVHIGGNDTSLAELLVKLDKSDKALNYKEKSELEENISDAFKQGMLENVDIEFLSKIKEYISIEEERRRKLGTVDESEDCIVHGICVDEIEEERAIKSSGFKSHDISGEKEGTPLGEIHLGSERTKDECYLEKNEDKTESEIQNDSKLNDMGKIGILEATTNERDENRGIEIKEEGIEDQGNDELENFAITIQQGSLVFLKNEDIEIREIEQYNANTEAEQESNTDSKRNVDTELTEIETEEMMKVEKKAAVEGNKNLEHDVERDLIKEIDTEEEKDIVAAENEVKMPVNEKQMNIEGEESKPGVVGALEEKDMKTDAGKQLIIDIDEEVGFQSEKIVTLEQKKEEGTELQEVERVEENTNVNTKVVEGLETEEGRVNGDKLVNEGEENDMKKEVDKKEGKESDGKKKVLVEEYLRENLIEIEEEEGLNIEERNEELWTTKSPVPTLVFDDETDGSGKRQVAVLRKEDVPVAKKVERNCGEINSVEDELKIGKEKSGHIFEAVIEGAKGEITTGKMRESDEMENNEVSRKQAVNEENLLVRDDSDKYVGENYDQTNRSVYRIEFDEKRKINGTGGELNLVGDIKSTIEGEEGAVEGKGIASEDRNDEESESGKRLLEGNQRLEKEYEIDEKLPRNKNEAEYEDDKILKEQEYKVQEDNAMSQIRVGNEEGNVIKAEYNEERSNVFSSEQNNTELETENMASKEETSSEKPKNISSNEVIQMSIEVYHQIAYSKDLNSVRNLESEPHPATEQANNNGEGVYDMKGAKRKNNEQNIEDLKVSEDEKKAEVKLKADEGKETQVKNPSIHTEIRRETLEEGSEIRQSLEVFRAEEYNDEAVKRAPERDVTKEIFQEEGNNGGQKIKIMTKKERNEDSSIRKAQKILEVKEPKVSGRMTVDEEKPLVSLSKEDVKLEEGGGLAGGGKMEEIPIVEGKKSSLPGKEERDLGLGGKESKKDEKNVRGNQEKIVHSKELKIGGKSLSGEKDQSWDLEMISASESKPGESKRAVGIKRGEERKYNGKAEIEIPEKKLVLREKEGGHESKKEEEILHRNTVTEVRVKLSSIVDNNINKTVAKDTFVNASKVIEGKKYEISKPLKNINLANKANDSRSVKVLPRNSKVVAKAVTPTEEYKANVKEAKLSGEEKVIVEKMLEKQTKNSTKTIVNQNNSLKEENMHGKESR